MTKRRKIIVIDDFEKINDIVDAKSDIMKEYLLNNAGSSYHLIYKNISYADIPTFGKRSKKGEPLSKDLLTYLTVEEMESIDGFDTAITKQSNIFLPAIFYSILGIKQLERRKGHQEKQHEHIKINDYANVFLVNDTMANFSIHKTNEVLDKLNKQVNWNRSSLEFELYDGDFTPITITHAIHGIGISEDEMFYQVRRNIFKNDSIIFIIETRPNKSKQVFLLLDKNPKFYSIINETNYKWQSYLEKQNKKITYEKKSISEGSDDVKTRSQQNKWRNMLAEEISNYTVDDNEVFCIFTMIRANFEDLGTVFRASHIKRFEICTSKEAYDINNGLLLCANADALFDKFLITVSEDKKLIFSFLLENNYLLREQLQLTEKIFTYTLNDKRMDYIEWHREEFYKREEERKK